MALLKILEVPNPLLKKKSAPVAEVTNEVRKLMNDMLETMYDAPGVGLAAPQVGILQRIVVIDVTRDNEQKHPYKMINPVITAHSETTLMHDEGCLSVPEQYAPVERFETVTVEYTDENGKKQTLSADGLLAICIQHELEHLDGTLFIDHLSKVKRDMIVRRVEKERRWKNAHSEDEK
ncbi:MAG: peptide deformylase [Alphaproteobacteria bacterium]|nr:peptide deformylase [Alphaproteobacteria bacterium]